MIVTLQESVVTATLMKKIPQSSKLTIKLLSKTAHVATSANTTYKNNSTNDKESNSHPEHYRSGPMVSNTVEGTPQEEQQKFQTYIYQDLTFDVQVARLAILSLPLLIDPETDILFTYAI